MASSEMDNEKKEVRLFGSDDSGPWLEVFPSLKGKSFVRLTVRFEFDSSLMEAV